MRPATTTYLERAARRSTPKRRAEADKGIRAVSTRRIAGRGGRPNTHQQDAAKDEARDVGNLAARAKDRERKVLVVGPREHVDDQMEGRRDAGGGADAFDRAEDKERDLVLAEADAEAEDTDPGAAARKAESRDVSVAFVRTLLPAWQGTTHRPPMKTYLADQRSETLPAASMNEARQMT